jgi:hypothetical protein
MCCNIIYFNSFVHQKLTKFVLDPDPSLNISTNLKPLIFFCYDLLPIADPTKSFRFSLIQI